MLKRYNFASSSFEFSTFLSSRNAKKIACSPHFHLLHLSGVILQDYIWMHTALASIFATCFWSSVHFKYGPGAYLKVDLELPTDWHVPILCIIFPLENSHCREKRYVEYINVLLNLFSQCNLWQNITFNDNLIFILRNTPVLQLGIFLHNRYALLLRMETLATE